jgi:hypothetical protein
VSPGGHSAKRTLPSAGSGALGKVYFKIKKKIFVEYQITGTRQRPFTYRQLALSSSLSHSHSHRAAARHRPLALPSTGHAPRRPLAPPPPPSTRPARPPSPRRRPSPCPRPPPRPCPSTRPSPLTAPAACARAPQRARHHARAPRRAPRCARAAPSPARCRALHAAVPRPPRLVVSPAISAPRRLACDLPSRPRPNLEGDLYEMIRFNIESYLYTCFG